MAKKRITGIVVKKFGKTISVVNEFKVKHPKYLKTVRKTKKFLVHDAMEIASVGAEVEIVETSPISKKKHFEILRVIDKK